MRVSLSVLLMLVVSGAAFAQTPRVTIEDDVAPASALACTALRMVQSERSPDALVAAARDAWLKSGVDAQKARAEAAKIATRSAEDMAALANDCAPFEIRSAPPAGG